MPKQRRWADAAVRRKRDVRKDIIFGAKAFAVFLAIGAALMFWPHMPFQSSAQTPSGADAASIERAGETRLSSPRAIDGDTIEDMATGERIRLVNIDTPETEDRARCSAEREKGERAKREARDLVGGAREVTAKRTGRVDRYGRTIAFVLVDGRDLGKVMMERGLARPWRGRREPWCAADGSLLP